MRGKCRFLFEHVEITAILAVFCGLSGSNGTVWKELEEKFRGERWQWDFLMLCRRVCNGSKGLSRTRDLW
jgi:hypothetical protein